MYKRKIAILITFCALFVVPGSLYAQLSVEGTFRPRSEYRNGYRMLRTPGSEPAYFISQRTRLSASYASDNYKIKVSGQDVRVWGGVSQLQDNPNVNIHEAWAQLDLSEALQLKLGRQELVYGTQRLLGSVNWTQQGRSHDALVVKYQSPSSGFSIDIGGAYNQQAEKVLGNTYSLNNYKVLSYLWLTQPLGPVDASVMLLTDGFEAQPNSVNYRYTYGTRLAYGGDAWQLSGSLYGQQGDDAGRRNVAAYMYAVKAGYTTSAVQFSAGYDYLSGGSASDANPARHTFSTLYATNHKFYGHMDYFLSIPADTKGGGLQDLHLGADYGITDAASLSLTYHHFALAEQIANPQNPTERLTRNLGSEFDLGFGYRFSEDISLKVGYSTMLPASSLDALQQRNGEASQHWGWAMLQLTPQIIQ